MAVTNLTNTKWLFNSIPTRPSSDLTFSINFISNNNSYTQLKLYHSAVVWNDNGIYYDDLSVYGDYVGWNEGEAYRTFTINGGTDVTNATLIAYLEANATQVITNVDIVLGSNTLTGVDTIKVVNANNTSAYVDFVYGTTPSTTTSIKIGDSTLTGVNTISVLGTDSNQKTFGYKPSGFTVTIECTNFDGGDTIYYKVNNDTEYTEPIIDLEDTIVLTNVSTIKFAKNKQYITTPDCTGDFANITFTNMGTLYESSIITMTQDSTMNFDGTY